jgi:hypothetical protein
MADEEGSETESAAHGPSLYARPVEIDGLFFRVKQS